MSQESGHLFMFKQCILQPPTVIEFVGSCYMSILK